MLRHWIEWLLTRYFWEGLSCDLFYLCLARGLNDWYQLMITVELDLMRYKGHGRFVSHPKKSQEKRAWERKQLAMASPVSAEASSHIPILCFYCSQKGHQAAVCLPPTPKAGPAAPLPLKPKKPLKRGKGKSRGADRGEKQKPNNMFKARKIRWMYQPSSQTCWRSWRSVINAVSAL